MNALVGTDARHSVTLPFLWILDRAWHAPQSYLSASIADLGDLVQVRSGLLYLHY